MVRQQNTRSLPLVKAVGFDSIYLLSSVVVALAFSWVVCALLNFSYSVWHDFGGIGDAIERFGPENHFKEGFHLTTKAERADLFKQINIAIHKDGEGLAGITYQVEGFRAQTLLREPEVIHLIDVAHLVTLGKWVSGFAFTLWLIWMALIYRQHYRAPSAKRQAWILGCVFVLLFAAVMLVGPTKFFYWMHEWAFPDGHQWFFYYQESLMSTMMYAPYLFGYIAIQWFLLAILTLVALNWFAVNLNKKGRPKAPETKHLG